jgi:hypothetical protein
MSLQPFRFLDLPPEIREKIYILISHSSSPYILLNSPHAHDSFPLNLLLANNQIYHELRPLYFTTNAFSITLLRRNEPWDYILLPSFLDNRRQIRSLRLNVIRWGPKNYFVNELVPVLEDCIMNGRLRDLEVRMRDVWLRDIKNGHMYMVEGNLEMMVGEQNANWESLMRLLRDPYLERAVLMAGPLGGSVSDEARSDRDQSLMPLRNARWVFDFEGDGGWKNVAE